MVIARDGKEMLGENDSSLGNGPRWVIQLVVGEAYERGTYRDSVVTRHVHQSIIDIHTLSLSVTLYNELRSLSRILLQQGAPSEPLIKRFCSTMLHDCGILGDERLVG